VVILTCNKAAAPAACLDSLVGPDAAER
jgi:hypothetical protein